MIDLTTSERKFLHTKVGRALLTKLQDDSDDILSRLRQGERLCSVIGTMSDGIEHGYIRNPEVNFSAALLAPKDMVSARLAIANYIDRHQSRDAGVALKDLLEAAAP